MIKVKNSRVELSGTKAENFKDICNIIIAFAEVNNYDVGKVGCDLTNAVLNLYDLGYGSKKPN